MEARQEEGKGEGRKGRRKMFEEFPQDLTETKE